MPRPVILGLVGDSGAGKTTIARGLLRVLGADSVTRVSTDDYHRYGRARRLELGLTPLDPECNHLDILEQHLELLREGQPVLKPVYRHADGTFLPPVYVAPSRFLVVEGLLGYHTRALRSCSDVRVFLAPPETLRRRWKLSRDVSRRGYTTDEVLAEIDRRESDADSFIRPQRRYADVVVSFADGADVEVLLRSTLPHPQLAPLVEGASGITVEERDGDERVLVSGSIDRATAERIEEAIWARMHFAAHLRSERLGEYTLGTDLRRSEALGLVQLVVLYHLVCARASLAVGGGGEPRADPEVVE